MELVVPHLRVAEVVTHPLDVGRAHVDDHVLDGLGMPVVTQQPRSLTPTPRCRSLTAHAPPSLGQ